MYKILFLILIGIPCFTLAETTEDFPNLKGKYLGQKPPSNIPELFAPGIVLTGANEMSICFSEKGDLTNLPMKGDQVRALLNSPGNGQQDIYWVSASFIEELKQLKFNLK